MTEKTASGRTRCAVDCKRIIVALDTPCAQSALALCRKLDPQRCRVKVGMQLFNGAGHVVLEQLHKLGFEVFLDLKYHDIPNTVAAACRLAAQAGVWMCNLHIAGGRRMLDAARDAIMQSPHRPLLIGVTVLTSQDASDLARAGVAASPAEQVLRLARLADDAGLQGVVCSALEARMLRTALPDLLRVTPGIRMTDDHNNDQLRVTTPADAIANGADYLVIGRPVTAAEDPASRLLEITRDVDLALLDGQAGNASDAC